MGTTKPLFQGPDPCGREIWLFCRDAFNWLDVIVRGGFLWQNLESYSVPDNIGVFLTALILFICRLIKQVKQIPLVHVIQRFGGGRGGRRTTTSTGSGHCSSYGVQLHYLQVHLISQEQICDKRCKIIWITASQKQKDSDVDAEVPLGTAMGCFQPHPTMLYWDPKDTTSTSQFLTMHRAPFLLGLCGTYGCLTAADHIRILVGTSSCHEVTGSQDNSGWKGHQEITQSNLQLKAGSGMRPNQVIQSFLRKTERVFLEILMVSNW